MCKETNPGNEIFLHFSREAEIMAGDTKDKLQLHHFSLKRYRIVSEMSGIGRFTTVAVKVLKPRLKPL